MLPAGQRFRGAALMLADIRQDSRAARNAARRPRSFQRNVTQTSAGRSRARGRTDGSTVRCCRPKRFREKYWEIRRVGLVFDSPAPLAVVKRRASFEVAARRRPLDGADVCSSSPPKISRTRVPSRVRGSAPPSRVRRDATGAAARISAVPESESSGRSTGGGATPGVGATGSGSRAPTTTGSTWRTGS